MSFLHTGKSANAKGEMHTKAENVASNISSDIHSVSSIGNAADDSITENNFTAADSSFLYPESLSEESLW